MNTNNYVISWNSLEKINKYYLYSFDPKSDTVLSFIKMGNWEHTPENLTPIGKYLLDWGPFDSDKSTYPFRLFEFDPNAANLSETVVQQGNWSKNKFWASITGHYPKNAGEELQLIPFSSFMLGFIPNAGRGSFQLWNFDPLYVPYGVPESKLDDYKVLPATYVGQEGFLSAFMEIGEGHQLIPMSNYVLDILPGSSTYRIWSFDPQKVVPLSLQSGKLPDGFLTDNTLLGVQSIAPISPSPCTGTIDYMRSKIKHVVYYMFESRSFDNVCGWLYEGDKPNHIIGKNQDPFNGANLKNFNYTGNGEQIFQYIYGDGKFDPNLNAPKIDPFHSTSDNLQQMFYTPKNNQPYNDYKNNEKPNMGGFVFNNADNQEIMTSFTPEQLPILNGLAKSFAVSDEWFCSIPGSTEANRAFSLTGSAYNKLESWEGGNPYKYWPYSTHRQSIWKVLWSNGITDWKIYNAILWMDEIYTYQMFLKGQIPYVDSNYTNFLSSVEQFKKDALTGNLPAFSYLEPIWIAPSGATSYHPGANIIPGETALLEIITALENSPVWENTALIITFSKSGGMYDHVSPPYAQKPWLNDYNDGFAYNILGSRVPTIIVSPFIEEKTVFRSNNKIPFDSTSFVATLLKWFGIPKSRWGLGERLAQAPGFEAVFTLDNPRMDKLSLTLPKSKIKR